MIVLDTNVLSALMRRDADETVVTWLDLQPSESVWTTAVTVFEIRFGNSSTMRTCDDGKAAGTRIGGSIIRRYCRRDANAPVWDGRGEKRSLARFASIPWTRASRESV